MTGLSEAEEKVWQAGRRARETGAECPYARGDWECYLWLEAKWGMLSLARLEARCNDPDCDDPDWR